MRRLIVFLLLSFCLSMPVNAVTDSPEITPEPGQVNPYKTRSELLMDATRYTGVFTPDQAANEAAIQKAFIDAFNRLYSDRERLMEDYAIILSVLTDTVALDAEAAAQQTECDVTVELIRKCVDENTRSALNQKDYQRRYDALVARYEAAKARLDELSAEKQNRAAKRESISRFIEVMEQYGGLLAEFDETLWCQTVESVTVHSEKDVEVTFRDGSTIHVDARLK